MTAFSVPSALTLNLPTGKEIRAMLNRPAVFITAILAGLIAFLALLGAVVYLVATNHPTDAVTGLLGGSLLVLVWQLRRDVQEVKSNTTTPPGGP